MAKLVTAIGLQKFLVASPQKPIKIKSVAIGSGTGDFNENILSLKQEVWRGNASEPIKEGNQLRFSAFVPDDVGGWTATEWGLIDEEGDLVVYGQFDYPVYKAVNQIQFNPELIVELNSSTDAELIVTSYLNWEHNKMTERGANDAHPISSITGLTSELNQVRLFAQGLFEPIDNELEQNKTYKVLRADTNISDTDSGVFVCYPVRGMTATLPTTINGRPLKLIFVAVGAVGTVTLSAGGSNKLIGEGGEFSSITLAEKEPVILNRISDTQWAFTRNPKINDATTTQKGQVQLNNTITSTSQTEALTAAQGKVLADRDFGVGQSTKNLSSERVAGVEYTNTDNKVRFVMLDVGSSSGNTASIVINSQTWFSTSESTDRQVSFTVGIGEKYKVTGVIRKWLEFKL